MCRMCDRELDAARGHLMDLIDQYREAKRLSAEQGIAADNRQHTTALAHYLNREVREHYGVVNGQIVAAAIDFIVNKGELQSRFAIDNDQVVCATMQANERLPENERITVNAAHEFLAAVCDLQQ